MTAAQRPGRDPDATVRIRRPAERRLRWSLALACVAFGLAGIGLAVWRPRPAGDGRVALPLADAAALLAAPTDATRLYRYRPATDVVVVLFGSVHDQALALNRVGAFVEKAGAPHDRVLDDAALHRVIARTGDSFDTYYLGHDYAAADLRRFYAAARADGMALSPAEAWLHDRLGEAGLLDPGAPGAVISAPPASAPEGGLVDASGRRTILRHEIAHGLYFTDPAYAAYVARWWQTALSATERAAVVRFLAAQGYDSALPDLMRNECQAYLVFTEDGRYFSAAALGLPQTRVASLRRGFLDGLPAGWLEREGLLERDERAGR